MKKLLLSAAILFAMQTQAQSVDSYLLKVEIGKTYSPLSGATNLTSGIVWDEENFKVPIGFTADVGGKTITDFAFSLGMGFVVGSDTAAIVNTFCSLVGIDIADRGLLTGVAKSPVRYQLTGTSPNRIFKMEIFNAGFWNESDNYGTMNDSLNMQVWLYETTNIVEMRFGPSYISHSTDTLFDLGASPLVGYGKNLDLDNLTWDKLYILTGSPSAPTVDSIATVLDPITVMTSFPANGTVYRFVPKSVATSVSDKNLADALKVYPTVCNSTLHVDNNLSIQNLVVEIYSSNGQSVKTSPLEKGTNAINVSDLSTGGYLIKVHNQEFTASYRFVKQ